MNPPTAKTIFMVDDDQDDCIIVEHAASRLGNSVELLFFKSGDELLDYFDRLLLGDSDAKKPHFVLLDLNMPRLGGKEVLAQLKRHTKLNHIPIAIYTTSNSPHEKRECEALGAMAYVVKPNSIREIEDKLLWLCQITGNN